ncbi:Metallophosphoesterase-like protein [Candidatus Terasakiella magnetica]|uniref:Metallophosphoesterase-like protein n=1 Tax=Candidatus Terasakiella magnetica TaxID=1867952 RepID=A0A1C3RHA2_9PROT|nr:metallophosphoesterase family protein [Candidatus Terasakiella magnetica]SCA56592.1 Metallophosphoesterase-like protein [Candidatus Terasakiella magnetica]
MRTIKAAHHIPRYHGKSWLSVGLPRKVKDWSSGKDKSIATDCTDEKSLSRTLKDLNAKNAWVWPKRKHFFFSDLHGDPDAFAASLVSSGGVKKTGPKACDFILSEQGKKANFIIGGDCFDKGPSSLNLLRTIHHLKKQGARVRVLAGNHDVRVLFGMVSVGRKQETTNEHFFIRTGQKIIPLLKEVWDEYLEGKKSLKDVPSKKKCRELLYPHAEWFEEFPKLAQGQLNSHQIERELSRIHKKNDSFEAKCEKAGLDLRKVYAAVQKWKELFLEPEGEFYWFFKQMRLTFKAGSFLFIHAGLDNVVAKQLSISGTRDLNRRFRHALKGDPYDFYYSPLCNTIRTKYRKSDHPFTNAGARHVRRCGISALIHGHRNLHYGQRIALRSNVLNFECDTTLDSSSRVNEKVRGRGAAVTILDPKGYILGISSDYPHIKVFHPQKTLSALQAQEKQKKVSR